MPHIRLGSDRHVHCPLGGTVDLKLRKMFASMMASFLSRMSGSTKADWQDRRLAWGQLCSKLNCEELPWIQSVSSQVPPRHPRAKLLWGVKSQQTVCFGLRIELRILFLPRGGNCNSTPPRKGVLRRWQDHHFDGLVSLGVYHRHHLHRNCPFGHMELFEQGEYGDQNNWFDQSYGEDCQAWQWTVYSRSSLFQDQHIVSILLNKTYCMKSHSWWT